MQTNLSSKDIQNLIYTNRCLTQKLKRLRIKYHKLKLDTEKGKEIEHPELKCVDKIKRDANEMKPRAIFLLDQIRNYNTKKTNGPK